MKFIVDAHLPPSLCKVLAQYGHEAIHTLEASIEKRDQGQCAQPALRKRGAHYHFERLRFLLLAFGFGSSVEARGGKNG
jgi:hypothetical protein